MEGARGRGWGPSGWLWCGLGVALVWLWCGLGVALRWLWCGLGVALRWLWCSLGVALGWLCIPESMPSICLQYGLGVALGGLSVQGSRFRVQGSGFKIRCSMFDVGCWISAFQLFSISAFPHPPSAIGYPGPTPP